MAGRGYVLKHESQQDEQGIRHPTWWTGGVITPVLAILFTIFWTLAFYWLVGDRGTDWKYGVLPFVPAESSYSNRPFPTGPAKRQVELPIPQPGGANATAQK
jgi:hypothetical protein